jgi:hypothetical protein
MMVNIVFDIAADLILSLESVDSLDFSLFDEHLVELLHAFLVVDIQLFLEKVPDLWTRILLAVDLSEHPVEENMINVDLFDDLLVLREIYQSNFGLLLVFDDLSV